MLPTATPADVGLDARRLERAFAILQSWLDEGVITAVASIVARRGRIAGAFYGGHVRPGGEPVGPESLFHLASIGKPMAALLVMRLVERGQLALEDRLAEILPGFAGGGRDPITVRQLLCHTSGLPQDPDLAGLDPLADTDSELRTYLRAELAVPIGSKVEYSNVGYGLIGPLVEAVDGRPFAEQLRAELLAPAGMADSHIAPPEALYPRIVHVGGTPEPGSPTERFNSAHARRRTHPAGSVVGAARDVAAFMQLFLDDGLAGGRRVIAPATAQLMRASQTEGLRGGIEGFMAWEQCAWGLGFDLRGVKRPHFSGEYSSPTTFGHSGVAGTFAWADPEQDLVVVMLGNRLLHNLWNRSRWSRFSTAVSAAIG